jgi:hypothetical protein
MGEKKECTDFIDYINKNILLGFNIHVILFVLSIRVFIQYSNPNAPNSPKSYIFLIAILTLNLIVGFLAILSLIFEVIYRWIILLLSKKANPKTIMDESEIL